MSYADGASVVFDSNNLTALNEDVFKPIVDSFIGNSQVTNFISVAKSIRYFIPFKTKLLEIINYFYFV